MPLGSKDKGLSPMSGIQVESDQQEGFLSKKDLEFTYITFKIRGKPDPVSVNISGTPLEEQIINLINQDDEL